MTIDAFLDTADSAPAAQRREAALAMLRRHLRGMRRRSPPQLAAARRPWSPQRGTTAISRRYFAIASSCKVGSAGALLDRAAEEGEIAPQPDFEIALDMIYAPLYFRLLIGDGRLDAVFTDALLELALRGLRR